MANGIFQQLLTTLRGRKLLAGSFVTNNTSSPTAANQFGDSNGVTARTGTGTITVTLPKTYGSCESIVVTITGGASTIDATYSAGVITITTYTSASAADTTGLRVNWQAVFSDRSP